jgi:hypothetical protein
MSATKQWGERPAKVKRPPFMRESAIQRACVQWFRTQYSPARGFIIYSTPNGGKRSGVVGVLVGEGMTHGIPDLTIPHPRGGYGSLYVEMKAPGGSLSEHQKTMIAALRDAGNRVEVCNSLDEFMAIVNDYLK